MSAAAKAWGRACASLVLLAGVLLVLLLPRPSQAGLYAWELREEQTPEALFVGLEVQVEVTVRNLGAQPWVPSLGDRLSYHWRDEAGELRVRDGLRTELPRVVAPGESITLDAKLMPPEQPGRYKLEWAMVRENVTWFPPPRDGPIFHDVEVDAGDLAWAPVSAPQLPERIGGSEEVSVVVTLENRGEVPWDPERGDAISYHWWSDEGELWVRDGLRTRLAEPVEAGARVELELRVRPPSHRGPGARRACLEIEPLRERVRWYGPADDPSRGPGERAWACTLVEADPLQWELVDDASPSRLSADPDEQRVTLRLRNAGSEPWPEGDQLAYQWRPLDGGERVEGLRTQLPAPVIPGELVEVEARLLPPPEPGRYLLRWGIVREGVRWYADPPGGQALRVVEVAGPNLAWGLVRAETPKRVWVNRSERVEVELVNLGTATWSEASGDHLAYHWLDVAGRVVESDGLRTSFPGPVAPGEHVVVEAKLRGPAAPGRYKLQWEPVREHVRWFGRPAQIGDDQAWTPRHLDETRARWLSAAAIFVFSLAGVGGMIALRMRPVAKRRLPPAVLEQLPLVWLALALTLLVAAFHDFSAIEAWPGAGWLAASGAWLIAAPVALARGRVRAWLAALMVTLLAALALADLVYMHYFGSIVPVVALTASHHLGEVGDSALAELDRGWGWLAVLPVSGLICAALWPKRDADEPAANQPAADDSRFASRFARVRAWLWRRLRPQLPALGVCLLLGAGAVVELGVALGGELGQRVFSEQAMVGRFGYVNAHLFDLARTLRERGRRGRPRPELRAAVDEFFRARADAIDASLAAAEADPERPLPAYGAAEGHNLLLIQVEAAQSWVIGLELRGQEITPFLNRLRAEADYYPWFIDQTNQGKTSDAEYAVLNSQHPLGEGAVCFLRADNHFFSLAHLLGERGYTAVSAHPYKRGFWNRAVLHPRYGFERSWFRRELGEGLTTGWGLADGPFFDRITPKLAGLPEPWFAFLITLSLHHPYEDWPAKLSRLDLGPLEGTRVGNYLEAMHYFDRSLAALLAGLDEAGLLDHTVVAIYGDHDARFELDEYPEVVELAGGPDARWDPASFHRLERVPAFVLLPESARAGPGGELELVGGHVDLAPTLLHHLGVPRPASFVGRPLLRGLDGPGFAAYPDGSAYGAAPGEADGAARMFVAEGPGIPREGGCFGFPEGGSREREACEALAEAARVELEMSRAVVDHDLHRDLLELRR